jgi:hypothetical protein
LQIDPLPARGGDARRGYGLSSTWKVIDREGWQIDHGVGSGEGQVSGAVSSRFVFFRIGGARDGLTSSATLTRVLRLDPTAVVLPLEPPHLHGAPTSPKEPVDALIPVGLTSRPELATQQAVGQATLVRLGRSGRSRSSPA